MQNNIIIIRYLLSSYYTRHFSYNFLTSLQNRYYYPHNIGSERSNVLGKIIQLFGGRAETEFPTPVLISSQQTNWLILYSQEKCLINVYLS